MTRSDTLTHAQAYLGAGLSVIPVRRDGTKAPTLRSWKTYQERLPTPEEVKSWFGGRKPPGIGVVCGAVSGGLECLDLDAEAETIFPRWRELVEAEAPGLTARLSVVQTPKTGYHVRYRCPGLKIPGSTKLASAGGEVLMETRGEGGYALAPGSPPECHPSKRLYVHIAGPPMTKLADITPQEREILIALARSFDRSSGALQKRAGARFRHAVAPGTRVGDDFDLRGPDWADILTPHGWTPVPGPGEVRYWRRPGKEPPGCSATTGYCRREDGTDLLAVFSSNAPPFEGPNGTRPCTCYGKFAAYALLNHAGDFREAAQALARQGYGGGRGRSPAPADASGAASAGAAAPGDASGGGTPGGYLIKGGCLCRLRPTPDGPILTPLGNFWAKIVEEVTHDDGCERRKTLALEGALADGQPLDRVEVGAGDFARLDWTLTAWGSRPVIYAGLGARDHLRAALQLLSTDVRQRTIYAHTGWRQLDGGWHYLHAGGSIGAEGSTADVAVSLPSGLGGYQLPNPPEGAELTAAVRASLGLLRLGPDRLTFPLLAAVYRAVLGDTDFALHLAGPTGSYKTEAAALAQQHFGAGMDARHLPVSWASTGNALEGLAFTAKDALMVVDDFCPSGGPGDVQRSHRDADRLFRGQGNRAGRLRLRADASLRPAKPPRGLVLSTGEDTPRGQSLRARLLVLEVTPGDFGPLPPAPNPQLTKCQQDAAAGLYAAALAGYIRWLAPQLDSIRARLRDELAGLRDRARGNGQHARTPGMVADLGLGLRYFLDFACRAGAISESELEALWARGWAALGVAAAAQAAHLAAAEPAALFLRLLAAALASGAAHVASESGDAPPEPRRWGWRVDAWPSPQGVRVGWLTEGELFLEPDASFAVVQRFARDQGEGLTVSAQTLRRRLNEQGFLATTDTARGRLTVRKTLQGARREVLHLAAGASPPLPPAQTSQPSQQPSHQKPLRGKKLTPIGTVGTEKYRRTPPLGETAGSVLGVDVRGFSKII